MIELKEIAIKVGEFLTSLNAFEQTWAPNEKKAVQTAVLDSLKLPNCKYWYFETDGLVLGAIGIRENKYGSDGYEMDQDYIAVHKGHRRKGLATRLLKQAEDFVKNQKERYIHILSCDIESYIPALDFYKANGYQECGKIPDYYVKGEGRIDLFKAI